MRDKKTGLRETCEECCERATVHYWSKHVTHRAGRTRVRLELSQDEALGMGFTMSLCQAHDRDVSDWAWARVGSEWLLGNESKGGES